MNQRVLTTSLIGDALALGAHWIYSQRRIAKTFDTITSYSAPATDYHLGKQAGDLTHYGDQTMVLLRSVVRHGRFDLAAFAAEWQAFWESPETESYRDGATKGTLANLRNGASPSHAASPSDEFAGAARIGPLFTLDWDSDDDLVAAARAQTAFTHRDPAVVESAEFFARVALAVASGATIPDALRDVAALGSWKAIPDAWLEAAFDSSASSDSDLAATKAHGLTCHVSDAFPATCHLLLRHPDDVVSALTANAASGGDSAARGMIIGMIHGARTNAGPLPATWLDGLRVSDEIQSLVQGDGSHV